MGLLKTIGKAFVEEMPAEEFENDSNEYFDEEEMIREDVELESVNTNTLIDDIYSQNNLYDRSKSIFKVEELINSLPKEMVTDTKRSSVLSILGNFGLTNIEVVSDGENRIEVLNGVKEKINMDYQESISEKEEQIEEFKKNIANLEIEIANEQNEMKVSNETISAEGNRIKELVKFIRGEN